MKAQVNFDSLGGGNNKDFDVVVHPYYAGGWNTHSIISEDKVSTAQAYDVELSGNVVSITPNTSYTVIKALVPCTVYVWNYVNSVNTPPTSTQSLAVGDTITYPENNSVNARIYYACAVAD